MGRRTTWSSCRSPAVPFPWKMRIATTRGIGSSPRPRKIYSPFCLTLHGKKPDIIGSSILNWKISFLFLLARCNLYGLACQYVEIKWIMYENIFLSTKFYLHKYRINLYIYERHWICYLIQTLAKSERRLWGISAIWNGYSQYTK